MSKKLHIIDTNFVLRYLLADQPKQYQIAKSFFQDVKSGKLKACLETAVIIEVIFVLSSYYKVPRVKIITVLNTFLRYRGLIMEDKEAIMRALEIYESTNLHIVDSLLAAKSSLHELILMSFDNELQQYVSQHHDATEV